MITAKEMLIKKGSRMMQTGLPIRRVLDEGPAEQREDTEKETPEEQVKDMREQKYVEEKARKEEVKKKNKRYYA